MCGVIIVIITLRKTPLAKKEFINQIYLGHFIKEKR